MGAAQAGRPPASCLGRPMAAAGGGEDDVTAGQRPQDDVDGTWESVCQSSVFVSGLSMMRL